MKFFRRITIGLTAFVLLFPSSPLLAIAEEGNYSSKDEIVYATLNPSGKQKEMYVVNAFDVRKAGQLVDHGSYTEVKNLTDVSEIKETNAAITFQASEGKFYYQGNMDDESLPWNISITYFLDGEQITPNELAGKDGHVEIIISTSANKDVDPVFYENYLLQIGLTLDPSIYDNIEAPDAMIANAGQNNQVTFTVMPEKEAELELKADVKGFTLDGMDINGIPSSMSIDAPDLDERMSDMHVLTDAIGQLNEGVSELRSGASQLNGGVSELYQGSQQYKDGMKEISGASSELIQGSELIDDALRTISQSLQNTDTSEMDLASMQELPEGLTLLGENLNTVADGLHALRTGYMEAYNALDQAMADIPSDQLSAEVIQGLYVEGIDHEVLNKLTETYTAALTAKGTYTAVKEGLEAVDTTLEEIADGVQAIGSQLEGTADAIATSLEEMDISQSISALQEGLTEIATNYGTFHDGLVEYTSGVQQLHNAYGELHEGIGQLSNGTNELENGVGELHSGTTELYEATNDLPAQIQDQIDDMISDFENSDFEAKSFVSSKNDEKVNTVQFILKTESIELEDESETEEVPIEEEKSFWDRFWGLFS